MSEEFPPAGALGDISAEELRAHLHRLADWAADYRRDIGQRPVSPSVRPGDVTAGAGSSMPLSPEPVSRILDDIDAVVLPGILHWGHPAFLSYFGSTSNGPALLGEIAAAALNVSAMTWKTSPAATELETVVVGWIRDFVGLDPKFTGIVYDTASVSLSHALATAREGAAGAVRHQGLAGRPEIPRLRVYASEQAHSSVEKAMILLGLGEENVVRIPVDSAFRMRIDALESAIIGDEQIGYRPMAVVATVGTTSTASVDPVSGIAALCAARHLWLHIDAAYGGALAAHPEGRWALRGSELADSIVINPHKWLFVPLDFSVLFLQSPESLRAVFSLTPEYLEGDARSDTDERSGAQIDYMDYGIQLGRRFRALKAWMTFRAFGASGIQSRLREHCRLAALLASWIEAAPRFELAAPQLMGIVCFRYIPPGADDAECDRVNAGIVEHVNTAGKTHITQTRLRGRACLRIGLGNIATTETHVRLAWDEVNAAARHFSGAEV